MLRELELIDRRSLRTQRYDLDQAEVTPRHSARLDLELILIICDALLTVKKIR
jgi:hypothetical protein